MEFGILGPLQVQHAGQDVDIRRGMSRTLLATFLLRATETVTTGALMEVLWGEDSPRNPANALQIQISHLRKALSSVPDSGRQPIVTRPGGYVFDVEPASIDAVRFERLVLGAPRLDQVVTEADADLALGDVDQALAMWRGEVLADVEASSFASGDVARLSEMRWRAVELRIDLLLALGRHAEAVGELSTFVVDQPLRERLHEQLMTALYRCGRQADALRAFESARTILVEELGIDPGTGLQDLERRVLAQDPWLDWQRRQGSERPGVKPPVADWRRTFVPAPLTALIGREGELARVGDLMVRSRLVTLTGPGGAGKTRMAISLAGRETEGSVWYVDLSPIELPELVAPTVAASIGATTGPAEDPADVVATTLSAENGLLVLDTCEHVLSGAASLVSTLLQRAPGMRVLATSRRPLGVGGEAAWPVPPLSLAPPDASSVDEIGSSLAVQLFCARASEVRADFELSAQNASDVAGICVALDGLPLAIELAAARVDVLTPASILSRLQNRFDLLVQGASDAVVRQRTLRDAIDWSINLLSDDEHLFFARLGAFPGGFGVLAAEEVAGAGIADPLDVLSGLVHNSMVVTDGADRFHLLDTLRAYAAELLADLDADETRRRHAEYFTRLAERSESLVRGADQVGALGRLRTEIPNLRAAFEWSLSLGDLDVVTRLAGSLAWFWVLDGRLDVANRHLRRAAEIHDAPAANRAKVLWGYSLLVAGLGDLEAALQAAESSTLLARAAGDDVAIGAGLNAVAVAQWAQGDLDSAAAAHDEAIDRFVAAGDIWGESICRVLRARTALDRGDGDAEKRLNDGLEAARRCGDAHVEGLGLCLLGELVAGRGEFDEAIRLVSRSLELQESIGYTEGTISALHLQARFHADREDDAKARRALLRGLRLAWKMQHAAGICEALEGLARVALRVGDVSAAAELFSVALAERRRRGLTIRPNDQPVVNDLESEFGAGATRLGREQRPVAEVVADLLALSDRN